MSLDLTIAGGPIFATRSRVNDDSRKYGTFAATSMQGLLKRIVDGDPESYWHEDPETAADDVENSIIVSFQLREALISREIDFVLLQNINLKNFKLEYSNDDSDTPTNFTIVPGFDYQVGVANNALTDLVKSFTTIEATYLKLTMYRTIVTAPVNPVKQVGGIYACLSKVQLTSGAMTKYEIKGREQKRKLLLADGTRTDEAIRRSAVSCEHWGATVGLDLVPKSERDLIRAAKREATPITFFPEPYDVPRDCFTSLFKDAWAEKYSNTFKGVGYSLDFSLEEAGSL